ncbi:hypothetical protein RM697_09905 [Ichthyenterobacterium sp. W332]|uniref:Outer membrane protein beta-barrel domain-containing protein n=1 Tax=Microcosmobacter mediterraneus TaxID=3075607 RepID=A0ABU2YMA4_9FLAO|nr:hypothetical protein [Ichthyenterobacterium sp. W332]MDT0558962.1 hypothetical protein [Ichthyenterobacterium sp. W332]
MKRIVLIILISCFSLVTSAQDTVLVDGKPLELKTEISGKLDLLWNIIDRNYRYFIRTEDGKVSELLNTKKEGRTYNEEYKDILGSLTSKDTSKLKFTLYSLRNFIDAYNEATDSGYVSKTTSSKVQLRLGLNGGITNNPFVENPTNEKVPLAVLELELLEKNILPRHSGFLQVRRAFENDNFKYSTTEFSIGYRYRIIKSETFSFYGQVKFATLNFAKAEIEIPQGPATVTNTLKDTAFDTPFIFGVGAELAVGDSGFITLNYGELFALLLDNQGNFSTDITLGYKLTL